MNNEEVSYKDRLLNRLDFHTGYIMSLTLKEEYKKDINISHLPSANYIISIKTSDGIQSFKFIKK